MKTQLAASLVVTVVLLTACRIQAASPRPVKPQAPAVNDIQDFVFLGEARPLLIRLHVRLDGKPLEAAWQEFMKYLFTDLDVNADGTLSKEEVLRALPVEQILGGGLVPGFDGFGRGRRAPPARPSLDALDSDKDGKVTLAELSAFYRRKGFAPFQFQLEPPPANPLGAVANFLGGPRPDPPVEAVAKAIFRLFDANKDGKLTKEELAAAPDRLLALDEDEDEIVTTQELVPETSSDLGSLAAMLAMARPGRREGASTSSALLVPVLIPNEVPADLVRRFRECYGKSGGREEKLVQADIGLDDSTFALLDLNHDRALDSQEMAGFVKCPADLELVIRLGKRQRGEASIEIVTSPERSELVRNLQLKNGLVLLNLVRTRTELRGNDEERTDRLGGFLRQQLLGQFRQADTNGDGFLDVHEAGNSRQFRSLFKTLDRGGRGKVSDKDLLSYLDHLQEMQHRATAACVTLDLSDQSRGLFELLDSNREGRLGLRQIRQAPRLIEQLDHGDKGFITKDDVPRAYRLELRCGPSSMGSFGAVAALFERYLGPPASTHPEPPRRGPIWFCKMDRNRDGNVSRKEFLLGEGIFRKIDGDGDGLISVEEAERFDAMHRPAQATRIANQQ